MTTRPRPRPALQRFPRRLPRGRRGLAAPAGTRRLPAALPVAALVAVLLLALLATGLAACSTARRRDTPEGPLTLLKYRDAATEDYFRDVYRSGNLYEDFRPALVVDAIVEDMDYRRLYVDMQRKQFLLSDADAARLLADQEQQFQTRISILLLTYEGTNTPIPLTRSDAAWRLFLRDDDGQLQSPSSITRIRPDSSAYLYIDRYFRGLDRWSTVYEVDFPKLSKGALGAPVGAQPFQLIITGVRGTVTLKWDKPALFYAGKERSG
jgi:hypothetical protein